MSCIENLFPASLLKTELQGKKFNLKKEHAADGEYGKSAFAKNVVQPITETIDFSGFGPLLERIVGVILDYAARRSAKLTIP